MDTSMMAVALLDEIKTRAAPSGDWEQDFTRLQQQADRYERQQAIKATLRQIVQYIRRPTTALKGAHA